MKRVAKYYLEQDGSFVIEDYNCAKPFADFFPGIAGIWGIPMWVFFVNRGQGIASFGIESKDKAIMEFQPANKSFRLTSTHGFRTFLKVKKGAVEKCYEPFQSPLGSPFKITQKMKITSHDLTIEEVNMTLGVAVLVNYFTVPEEPFSGFVRTVTVKNISKDALAIQMVDGLPLIMPYGQNEWYMKNMCRTIEAWFKVCNLEKKAPYYQLNVEAADVPQVKHIKEGNFYFSFDPRTGALFEPVVETAAVFGSSLDLINPEVFFQDRSFAVPKRQETDNRTPSAMSFAKFTLKPATEKEIVSVTGFEHSLADLNETVAKVTARGFVDAKRALNRVIIEEIKSLAFTNSASSEFNYYTGQTFLDNVLRGGLPISLQSSEGPVVFNVYSRKHGDLERDYNFFRLSPTFLSQGNGNYRDVNQNRRNDVWFNPDVKESAIVNFLCLLQADGYNPLIVWGMMFVTEDVEKATALTDRLVKSGDREALKSFLKKGFMPGDLFKFIMEHDIKLKCSSKEFLAHVLGICQKNEIAQHGEGYWSDHWTYNLDLIESFLALYPEKLRYLLLENKQFTFYHNSAYVLPRDKRYMLTDHGVRQYASLHEGKEDKERGHKLRVHNGEGEVYHTNFIVKMLCLIANKVATLDPGGIGIEMEANKPNWCDSLNGLPGLIGSSISETFEVKRFAQFLIDAIRRIGEVDTKIEVFEELHDFVTGLGHILSQNEPPLEYWKKANDVKEAYRAKVRDGIWGSEKEFSVKDISRFLELVISRMDLAVGSAVDKGGLFPTYFYHKVTKYEFLNASDEGKENVHVRPLEFERHDLPLFLEGFVHALRSEKDAEKVLALHEKVRKSAIFDKELGMYKICADLTRETEEIGRMHVFPRGWLENESIWLHMEYKYLLELLRMGFYEEFYRDFATACVAFRNPSQYGRSILENTSFIVSSAHPDKDLHGQGFVARLSGSTAEFVHIWMMMNAGPRPFTLDDQAKLQLRFRPALKGQYFTDKETMAKVDGTDVHFPMGTYAFKFMGKTLVVYHNKARKDTFGPQAAAISRITLSYSEQRSDELVGDTIPSPFALDIRDGKVARIDIHLE